MTTLRQAQAKYGPYYFGANSAPRTESGGGQASTPAPSAANALGITASSPTTMGGMIGTAFSGSNVSPTATLGLNTGLNLAGMFAGVPAAAITTPAAVLGQLSQAARRANLPAIDTGNLGLSTSAINAALGLTGGPNVSNNIAQGLGLTGAQLANITLALTGLDAASTTPSHTDSVTADAVAEGMSAVGISGGGTGGDSGSASGPGGSAGAPSGGGDSGNAGDFHTGGLVGPGSPKGPERKAMLLEKEFVVNRKAAVLHRDLLKAINSGASRADLAAMLKKAKR